VSVLWRAASPRYGVVSGLWRAVSLGGWCVWIMARCFARRIECLDYGVLLH
jgi:hypothetical protein